MQGRIGVVTRAIAELEPGQVKIGGEMWTARCFYDEEPIAAGSRVEVVKIEGRHRPGDPGAVGPGRSHARTGGAPCLS